jgi:hypothetical protein
VPRPAEQITREALEATAWQQGSLLPDGTATPPILWAHPERQGVKPARTRVAALARKEQVTTPVIAEKSFGKGDRLVVISQTCDVLKVPEQLPQVEAALVITTVKEKVIADALNLGSARYRLLKRLPDGSALVVDYAWRTFLDKGFLVQSVPDNSVLEEWGPEDRRTFARWLARRYGRPVLSDEDVEQIAEPVRDRWRRLVDEDAEEARRYSEEFPELRYRREEDGSLTVFILSLHGEPDPVLFLEMAQILAEALEPIHGALNIDPEKRSYHTFTKADELSTAQIDLEWASYEEGQEIGALPE